MKKLIISAILLTSCIEPSENTENNQTNDNIKIVVNGNQRFYSIGVTDYETNGMKYKIFQSASGGVSAVNITKDSLEIAVKIEELESYKIFKADE